MLRVGYVGTGGNAQGHLRRLAAMDGVEIGACCDISEDRAKSSAAEHGGEAHTDWRRMLDGVDLDVCYFSLPPFAHEGAEAAAAAQGLHIFVEKPVVMDMDRGYETKEAIDKAGVLSCVGYQLRYQPAAHAVRDFLADKAITMAVTERWGGIAGGPDHWWRVMSRSGGMLHEQATHQLDILRMFAGDVVEVYKKEALRVNTDAENNTIPDAEVVMLEFASGAIGYITTSSALTDGGGGSRVELIVEGHLRIQYGFGDTPVVLPKGAAEIPEYPHALPASIDDAFIQAIQQNDPSIVLSDYTEGLKTCAITVAANESAQTGRPVRVPVV
ncbi:Gfo/Idh/MocA family oxidoreductase [Candidatus Poribacteria bacterium]|jgi:predicted dehydrogenase|nr:Gfo/Idh/MocA family oxidoreductase [Candidatus Poribacteria bacterium]MBT5712778.1 Gfo/Idh/MocA family oxidoreductase [Candidatus Poribacteria bacterium]MBT7100755.1 Gfo/Idh/MocA family oxidoreductase [Candidatus Poribacteria bacterium]MBT7803959.1 Gfo/Idh/MocA family oxidoreductase [Candidatus Poribacteria bacterium]